MKKKHVLAVEAVRELESKALEERDTKFDRGQLEDC